MKVNKKIKEKKVQDIDLQSALRNLARDGVKINAFWSTSGDSKIVIQTKNWKTELGANDLGVWLESQQSQKTK